LHRRDHAVLAFGELGNRLDSGVLDAFPVHIAGKAPIARIRPGLKENEA
jgi:hypothetical protein